MFLLSFETGSILKSCRREEYGKGQYDDDASA